jgi:hypothetical protein
LKERSEGIVKNWANQEIIVVKSTRNNQKVFEELKEED